MRGASMTRSTIAVLALSTAAACPRTDDDAKRAAAFAKTTEEARAIVAAISVAYNSHDAAKVASHDAPDYVSMFHGFATATGPAADIASVKEQSRIPPRNST